MSLQKLSLCLIKILSSILVKKKASTQNTHKHTHIRPCEHISRINLNIMARPCVKCSLVDRGAEYTRERTAVGSKRCREEDVCLCVVIACRGSAGGRPSRETICGVNVHIQLRVCGVSAAAHIGYFGKRLTSSESFLRRSLL